MQILELQDRDDVLYVGGETNPGTQMRALAKTSQSRSEYLVTEIAQLSRNRCPLPAAAERSMHDDEGRYAMSPPI